MEEKYLNLLIGVTGLDKEFIVNSMQNAEGETIVKNQFKEKNKVFKIDDWNKREANIKADIESNYLNSLTELAKTQNLPSALYNATANNIISAQNKKLATVYGIELDDYSNTDIVSNAIKENLSKVDNTQLQSDFNAQVEVIKGHNSEIENLKKVHANEIKQNNISISYSRELNNFPIDYETEDELINRRTVADSVFNQNYNIDIVDNKTIVTDKKGNVLKNETTKEPLSIQAVFDTEISKYVTVKKERSNPDRKPGVPIIKDGGTVSREFIDKQIDSGNIKPQSREHIDLETKLVDQK